MKIAKLLAASALAPLAFSPSLAQTPGATATNSTATNADTSPAVQPGNDAGQGDIVVTGSRIPRPTYDRDQPTVTTSGQSIDARGFTSVAQALNETPGFGIADSSSVGNQGNGFGVGQAFVNLYSLGSQRTLTLVNGRRFVGANPASVFSSAGAGTQVDLNVIPTILVDRVETISVGGAPIYGADAIAGTVNFILKKNYQGINVDAQSGIAAAGDLSNWRVRGIAGTNFAHDRGNITVAADYAVEHGIVGTDRAVTAAQTGFIQPIDPNSPFKSVLVRNLRTFLGTQGGNPYFLDRGTLGPTRSITDSAGNLVRFAPDGTLVKFNTGIQTNDPTTFLGGDALNQATTTNLAVDSRRFNTSVFLNYELTDSIKFFGEGWYSKNKATNLANQPVYNTAFFRQAPAGSFDVNGNYIFRLSNPFLTTQARELIRANLAANGLPSDDNGIFYLGRANTDLVSGVAKLDQDLYRFVGGFNGNFQFLKHDWTWEVSGNYGRTRSVSITPSLVEPNLRRALNVTRDANGNIICAPFNPDPNDPTSPPNLPQYNGTISQTCAPLDLFGQGAPSQAARDYVTTNARTVAITSQRDFLATLGGTLATLPGGDLGISLGYENRREYSSFSPDDFYTQALGRSIPINSVAGSYITNEVFGELRAPVIGPDQHIPLVYSLTPSGAVRYVRNSVAGNTITWTAGGRWEPVRDIAIRGNFTRAIRAPAVTELFAANQPAFDGGYDPCDAQNITSGPNPARRQANCTAAGIPANFSSLINSITIPINVIGNRNLQNEKANSWTVGAVVRPRFAPRLSLSGDYVSIDLAGTIVASSARDVLSGCYDAANYPNNFYCSLITRDNTPGNVGQVLTLNEPYINQGSRVFRGAQFAADYTVPLPATLGALTIGANVLHIIKQYTVVSPGADATNTRGNIGSSIDQANLRLTFDHGPVTWFNEVRYIGPAVFNATEPPETRDVQGVPSYVVWNTSVAFNIDKRASLQINVDNVTNRGVPYPGSGNAAQNVYTTGLFGRTFLARFSVRY